MQTTDNKPNTHSAIRKTQSGQIIQDVQYNRDTQNIQGIKDVSEVPKKEFYYFGAASYVFLAGVFAKQFYVFASGSIQPADIVLLFSFVILVLSKRGEFKISTKDLPLAAFVFFVLVINILYLIIVDDGSFVWPCIYSTYCFLIVITFRYVGSSKRFARMFVNLAGLIILLQVAFFFLRIGRWYDSIRYMGTFNDPNQYAFYIFIIFLLSQTIADQAKIKTSFLIDVAVLVLIITSLSTGMILGFVVYEIMKFVVMPLYTKTSRGMGKTLLTLFFAAGLGFGVLALPSVDLDSSLNADAALNRVEYKISKLSSFSAEGNYSDSMAKDRNIDKILLYPHYLFYGAGEGGWDRFDQTRTEHEIHSTWLGLLFYYGLLPFCFLLYWLVKNIKDKGKPRAISAHIALLAESFTLANQRQPFFWLLLMCTSLDVIDDEKPARKPR